MKVIATNIGQAKEVNYRGKKITTGIFKYPVENGIYLEQTDVKEDCVVDRRFHGGEDKACYMYSYEAYEYWKNKYSNLEWNYGMFGENITVSGLDETQTHIGAQYTIGEAIVEVSQPRQPCFKLGIRMGTQAILKQFINTTYSGVYVRVIKNGWVRPNDTLKLYKPASLAPTIAEAFYCLYQPELIQEMFEKVLACKALAPSCKADILKRLKKMNK